MNQKEYNQLFGQVQQMEQNVNRSMRFNNQREENLNKKQFLCMNSIPQGGIFLPPGDITRVNDTIWPFVFGTGVQIIGPGAQVPMAFAANQDGAFAIVEWTKVVFALTYTTTPSPVPVAPVFVASGPYEILAGSTVTNTGPTVVTGGLGLSPGSAVIGFPPGVISGVVDVDDPAAVAAKAEAATIYTQLAALPFTSNLTGTNLGGLTLTPGVYFFATNAQLTGTLTLNAQGNPDAVFVFQIGSTLTTATISNVVLANGAQAGNVFWQVGSSATLGTGTVFAGNILAQASITLVIGASNLGRLFALVGAVTLDTNAVTLSAPTPPAPIPGVTSLTGLNYLDPDMPNNAGQADGLTVLFSDAQSRRQFMDKPSDLNNYGHPLYPTRFPRPMLLNPNAIFQIALANTSQNTYAVALAFNGYRLRLDNITRSGYDDGSLSYPVGGGGSSGGNGGGNMPGARSGRGNGGGSQHGSSNWEQNYSSGQQRVNTGQNGMPPFVATAGNPGFSDSASDTSSDSASSPSFPSSNPMAGW